MKSSRRFLLQAATVCSLGAAALMSARAAQATSEECTEWACSSSCPGYQAACKPAMCGTAEYRCEEFHDLCPGQFIVFCEFDS
jgi:hypothetical protein